MGAALTYARRYALFTLVGIAGEDDLDAPDVQAIASHKTPNPTSAAGADDGKANGTTIDGCNGRTNDRRSAPQRPNRPKVAAARPTLETGQSAALCGRLVAELNKFGTADELALWAKQSSPRRINSPRATPGGLKRPLRPSWQPVRCPNLVRRWTCHEICQAQRPHRRRASGRPPIPVRVPARHSCRNPRKYSVASTRAA